MTSIFRLIQKTKPMRTLAILFLLLPALILSAQNDDVYFSPKHDSGDEVIQSSDSRRDRHDYNDDDGETYSDYEDSYYSDTETITDGSGSTYITNNYYGDYYESDYTTRMKRFYSPYMGFGYYSPCYTGYYDYYDPYYYSPGLSVSIGFGWGWGSGYGYGSWGYPYSGYYNPWYSHYDPWCSPYWYGGYCGTGYGYGHGYNHGYYDGYWNGYYDGYYGYPNYGGYYGYYGNYHYGPRYSSQGVSSYRNSYGEKKAPETVEMRSNDANIIPQGVNKDVLQPVKIDDSRLGDQPSKSSVKTAADIGRTNTVPVQKGEGSPVDKGAVKTETPGSISKGEMKPVNTQPDVQKDSRTITEKNIEQKTPDMQRDDRAAPSQKPNTVTPKGESRPATKPGYSQPNTERQVAPQQYENNRYQKPQRDYNYERNKETPSAPKSNNYQHNRRPSYEKKGDAPQRSPGRNYAPKSDSGPSRDISPKSYDRGGSFQAPERSGSFDRGSMSPAPSNRGGGGSLEQAPSKSSGRPAPR